MREYKFCAKRGWQLDFAWPHLKIALEVEGGAFSGHGHRSVGKFLRDMEKYNEAAIAGWFVLRCTPGDIKNNQAPMVLGKKAKRENRKKEKLSDMLARALHPQEMSNAEEKTEAGRPG